MEANQTLRRITDHKTSKLNREHVEVHATDEKNADGANHRYRIEAYKGGQDSDHPAEVVEVCEVNFQNGGLKDVGPNGITDQALIAIVLDRLRGFNSGPYGCRENSIAITKLEEVMMWMEKRSNDRARRGVEGVRAV